MQMRTLGNSEIQISPVILGAWAIGGWMWGGQDDRDAIDAIRASLDAGVTAIDTAPVYGFGHSEELVAKALENRRNNVVLLTKFGLRWDHDGSGELSFQTQDLSGNPISIYHYAHPDSVIEECENSLRRLGTDYIDVYQIHWPDPTTPIKETFGAVQTLIEQGKVRAAGVSNYSPEQMAKAHDVVPLASSQPPFSMVLRDAEKDVIPWCIDHHVGVIPYSPLQRGLLTGKITTDYTFREGDHRAEDSFFQPESIRKTNALLDAIRPIAEKHSATLAQLVITWTIRQPGIAAPIVGARNIRQAQENAHAGEIELSDEDLQAIDNAYDASGWAS